LFDGRARANKYLRKKMNLLDELIEEKRIAYKKAYQEYLDLVRIKKEIENEKQILPSK
jgi:hypothetical protein